MKRSRSSTGTSHPGDRPNSSRRRNQRRIRRKRKRKNSKEHNSPKKGEEERAKTQPNQRGLEKTSPKRGPRVCCTWNNASEYSSADRLSPNNNRRDRHSMSSPDAEKLALRSNALFDNGKDTSALHAGHEVDEDDNRMRALLTLTPLSIIIPRIS
nr:hypothetical protein Itr_chr12CG00030 [Ipomoea trifida]GME17251.1 hypothetical protein Iba_scaffold18403CG1150 [Ipomoea batatas]